MGRIVKTIYILCYLHQEDLRRRVQLQLYRSESARALARGLFLAGRGEFRSGDYVEIHEQNQASEPAVQCGVGLEHVRIAKIVKEFGPTMTRRCNRL